MSLWFTDGLRFECTRCGDCCRGEPGFVWVTLDEAAAIAAELGMDFRDFESACMRHVENRMSLLERPNGDCILWQDGVGCRVYSSRPSQCRTFPFWPDSIKSPESWRDLSGHCRGVDRGRRFSQKEILALSRKK